MTSRALVATDADTLQAAAFYHGADVEREPSTERIFARIGDVTLVAELPMEPCS